MDSLLIQPYNVIEVTEFLIEQSTHHSFTDRFILDGLEGLSVTLRRRWLTDLSSWEIDSFVVGGSSYHRLKMGAWTQYKQHPDHRMYDYVVKRTVGKPESWDITMYFTRGEIPSLMEPGVNIFPFMYQVPSWSIKIDPKSGTIMKRLTASYIAFLESCGGKKN